MAKNLGRATGVYETLEARTLLAAHMVGDWNTAPVGFAPSSFVEFQGEHYFTRPLEKSFEVWKTNGTANGTRKVTEILDGSSRSGRLFALDDRLLIQALGRSFAPARLYGSDGTDAGTELIHDFPNRRNPGIRFGTQVQLDDHLLFNHFEDYNSDAPVFGPFLSITDGTRDKTYALSTSPVAITPASPRLTGNRVARVGNHYVFSGGLANERSWHARDAELWITDGSPHSARELKDLWDAGSSTPSDFQVVEERLFFTADSGNGRELWTSDLTAEGTRRVVENGLPAQVGELFSHEGELYFLSFADDNTKLWRVTSSTSVTAVVDLPGQGVDVVSDDDGIVIATQSDGSVGIHRIDVVAAGAQALGRIPGDKVTLARHGQVTLAQVRDENATGTTLVHIEAEGVRPLGTFANPVVQAAIGETFLFTVSPTHPQKTLFRATLGTTEAIAEMPGMRSFHTAGETVLFTGHGDNGPALWAVEGDGVRELHAGPLGQTRSTVINSIQNIDGTAVLTVYPGFDVFIPAFSFYDTSLVATVGDTLVPLSDRALTWSNSEFLTLGTQPWFFRVQGNYYFSVYVDRTPEIWRTDFTRDGTQRVTLDELQAIDARLHTDGEFSELHGPDEVRVFDQSPNTRRGFSVSGWADGRHYFFRDGHIWSISERNTDERRHQAFVGRPAFLSSGDDRPLLLLANDGTSGMSLWQHTGSGKFTIIPPEDIPSFRAALIERRHVLDVGERLYAIGDDGNTGAELWVIDGTEIRLVEDVRPGPARRRWPPWTGAVDYAGQRPRG